MVKKQHDHTEECGIPLEVCLFGLCEGHGTYAVENGPFDFDMQYCICPIGEALQEQEVAISI